jgi:hypothetical protein
MTPAVVQVTCAATSGRVRNKKGPSNKARPFLPINNNPGRRQPLLDLATRFRDPMDTTARGVR